MTMYLYRKAMPTVTLATAMIVLVIASQAQFRPPQPERKTPRALGVLETFKNGSRRLVPVAFFYEKHYYDATFYHATPVPFTLSAETVYEVQQFGRPLGTFTVQSATQNSAAWFGNGRFKPLPDPALLAKKAPPPPVVVEDSSRPVLHRHQGSEGDNPTVNPAPAATTPAEEDPNRPKLHRHEDRSADAPAPSESAQTGAGSKGVSGQAPAATEPPKSSRDETAEQDPDRPKLQRKEAQPEEKNAGTAPTAPTTPSTTAASPTSASPAMEGTARDGAIAARLTPSDDPDHPTLRRGKPVQEQSGRDLPDFKNPEPVSRQVAISDAGASEVQPLVYVCREQEREQMESSARALAGAELRKLAVQRGMSLAGAALPSAPPRPPTSSRNRTKPPTFPELKLSDEQFVPYDLDYSNYATVVFSARYSPNFSQSEDGKIAGAQSAGTKALSWVVTVVARQNEGKLTKLYSAVSDPRELDLYPEVRLVDALDPEGYGRAALLFREQKRDGVSWLLGRVTAYGFEPVLETPSR